MPGRNPGPPPVERSAVATTEDKLSPPTRNYLTIVDTLKSNQGAEAKAIRAMFGGDKALMDRFLAVAFSSLQSNSDLLANADPMSVVQAVKDSASLGLEPTGLTGEGAIVRYGRTAKFLPMWRGYLKRIRNSGKVQDIDCQIVYNNDEFAISLGTNPSIHHIPMLYEGGQPPPEDGAGERGGYRGVYAWALMPSGKYLIEYLTVDDVNAIRDRYAESYRNAEKRSSSPWTTAWGEQARKTAIRRLSKRLPGEAVDKLLLLDAQVDEAAKTAQAAAGEANVAVSEVRRLALAAVGQAPADLRSPETSDKDEKPVVTPTTDETGTATDLCGAKSPYGDGQTCVREKDHPANHKGADGSTW